MHQDLTKKEEHAFFLLSLPQPKLNIEEGVMDGEPLNVAFNGPVHLSSSKRGLVVADRWSNAIRLVDNNGNVSTIYRDENKLRNHAIAFL